MEQPVSSGLNFSYETETQATFRSHRNNPCQRFGGAINPHTICAAPHTTFELSDAPKLLARASFEGRAIALHHAYSAGEARAFLEAHPETALVLLDVVMETDDAGLQLCRHIRETLGNSDVQIVLRTGQPARPRSARSS